MVAVEPVSGNPGSRSSTRSARAPGSRSLAELRAARVTQEATVAIASESRIGWRSAAGLAVSPLLEGLATTALREIRACMRPRRYTAGEAIWGRRDVGLPLPDTRGVVEVVVGSGTAASAMARLRRGIFGEMGLLTGDRRRPQSCRRAGRGPAARPACLHAAVMRHPTLLLNVSRVLARRQQQSLRDLCARGAASSRSC